MQKAALRIGLIGLGTVLLLLALSAPLCHIFLEEGRYQHCLQVAIVTSWFSTEAFV